LAEMHYNSLLLPYTWACTDIIYSDILGNGGRKSGNIIKELKKKPKLCIILLV